MRELTILLQVGIMIILVAAAIADWRTWTVPLKYSNTLFALGVLGLLARLASGDLSTFLVGAYASGVILWGYSRRWLNHADTKLQIALWGLWPPAALWGMIAAGLWGFGLMILNRKVADKKSLRQPSVVPLALGAGLTFIVAQSIIFFVKV